jgi:3-deoxy-D-manno-octulosonic-acid transferase
METELWPNLLFYSQKTNLPTIIANARLSIKSTRNYSLLKPFLKKLLQDVIIAAQSDLDKERFITIGANLENVTTVGNIKFDLTIDPEIIAKANQLREKIGKERPVWIAASTHQGEDEQVLQAFKIAKEKIANLLLILVPRHPERFASVENLCKAYGFNAINYTQAKACGYNIEILIGNTVGDLLTFYGAADVAFVGGSLVPIGGHNLLEPVALNLPVISGPNLNNFIDISKLLLQKNALLIAHNPNELANELEKLFNDANLRQQMITSGQQVISANHGAIEKILLLITKNIL